jgi:hypothetical protein
MMKRREAPVVWAIPDGSCELMDCAMLLFPAYLAGSNDGVWRSW